MLFINALLAMSLLRSMGESRAVLVARQQCPLATSQGSALHDTTPYASNVDQSAKNAIPHGKQGDNFLVPKTTDLANALGYNQTDDDWAYGEDLDATGNPPEITARHELAARMTQVRALEASGFQRAYQAAYDYYLTFTPGGGLVAVNKEHYGSLVHVDHLFELNQVANFLKILLGRGQSSYQRCDSGPMVNLLGVDGGLNNLKSRVIRGVTVTWADITFDRATAMNNYFAVIKPYYMEVAKCIGNALAQKLTTPGLTQQCINYAEARFDAAMESVQNFLGGANGGPTRDTIEIDSIPLGQGFTSPAGNINDLFNSLVNSNTCPASDLHGYCNQQ